MNDAENLHHDQQQDPNNGQHGGMHGETAGGDGRTLAYVREVPGLNADQRAFLARRLIAENDGAAAAAVGVHPNTVSTKWKRDPVFLAAYQRVTTAATDDLFAYVEEEIARRSLQLPQTFTDLLTAETPIVDKTGQVVGSRPDWSARAKGLEAGLRVAGKWNPPDRGGSADTVALAAIDALRQLQLEAQRRRGEPPIIEGQSRPAD